MERIKISYNTWARLNRQFETLFEISFWNPLVGICAAQLCEQTSMYKINIIIVANYSTLYKKKK